MEDYDIAIAGRWAYSIEPPDDIVQATERLAAYYFRLREAPVFNTVGSDEFGGELALPRSEPQDVQYLLIPYKREPMTSAHD